MNEKNEWDNESGRNIQECAGHYVKLVPTCYENSTGIRG